MTSFGLITDPWGRLVLIDDEGTRHVGVEPIRAFPLSDPGEFVSIRDADGHELVWIERLADLPEPVRSLLEDEIARREFLPRIEKVLSLQPAAPPHEWEVLTDRGSARFTVDDEENLRRLRQKRFLVTDQRGLRYLIADLDALDASSRRLLEPWL